MRKRFAIVTPWFGDDATGGAESLARELAERLAREHDVSILTTCSRSFLSEWDENYYAAGITHEPGITVRRFTVDPRSQIEFDALNAGLLARDRSTWDALRAKPADTDVFIDQSINSSELEAYLGRDAVTRYDAVLFLPYLYGITVRGIEAFGGRAHLLPCLHDEAYARIPRIEDAFHRAATILANSSGEAELALRLYGPGILHKLHVIGSGIERDADAIGDVVLPERIRAPFILYLGRRDATKGLDTIVEAQRSFRAKHPEKPLALVVAGPGTTTYEEEDAGIVDLGFVEGGMKNALLARAVALVQPSPNESYSRVLMEAWFHRKPVAVDASCLATASAVRDAGGGLAARGSAEWLAVFEAFATMSQASREALGASGFTYAESNSDWNAVLGRLFRALDGPADSPKRGGERRIDQFVQTLEYGDAISDYARHIQSRLRTLGFSSTIFAEGIGPLVCEHAQWYKAGCFDESSAMIYHHSIASEATNQIAELTIPKALIYHNITPAEFFEPYSPSFAELLANGKKQTEALMDRFNAYIGDSSYNSADLEKMGAAKVTTVPLVVDFQRFDVAPARGILGAQIGAPNVLFVGRVSPNKGVYRLVQAFEAYLCFEPQARLTIVGRYDQNDPYFRELQALIGEARLGSAVQFAGMVNESQLLAFYQSADLYVSLSEHEGFCVPLVEAMFFDIPILALGATAVPETLGEAGIMIDDAQDQYAIAAIMNAMYRDESIREAVIAAQRRRRISFEPEVGEKRIDTIVELLGQRA